MKTITKQQGHVIVMREVGYYDEKIFNDGDSVAIKQYKDITTVSLVKDGKIAISTDFIKKTGQMPKGAAARMGWSNVYVSSTTLEIIENLMAEVAAEEADEKAPVTKVETFVVNPTYAHLTNAELAQKIKDYDLLQNEGADGYNPFRDNYYVPAGE